VLSVVVAESAPASTPASPLAAWCRPTRWGGRHARAHRVVIGEIDVHKGQRAGGGEALGNDVRTRGIRCSSGASLVPVMVTVTG